MKRSAFQYWMVRIALAAALLLVLVPTAGRVAHAAAGGDVAHAAHAAHHDQQRGDNRPAIGDPDCDYCPLLASMAGTADVVFALADVPLSILPPAAPAVPRLRWRHPWGLGSRGPPHHG